MQNADKSSSGRTRLLKGAVAVQRNSQDILAPPTPYSYKGAGSRVAVAIGSSLECCTGGLLMSQIPVISRVIVGNGALNVYFDTTRAVTSWTATATALDGNIHTASGTSSPIRITGLTNNMPYTVQLGKTDANGASLMSTPYINAVPAPVPSAPSLTCTVGNRMLIITITPPDSDGGSDITGYERSLDFELWEPVTLSDENTYTESELENGRPQIVYIRAVTNNGQGEVASITGTPVARIPDAPQGLTVSNTTKASVTIDFTQPLASNTPSVTNYKYSTDGITYIAFSPAIATTPITITGLIANTNYTIRLKAVNSDGDSAASDPISVTPTPTMQIDIIRSSGTWTAPDGVTSVEYLVVGGGGGGGGAYSFMDDFGETPVVYDYQKPSNKTYWIRRFDPYGGPPNELMEDTMPYLGTKTFKLTATDPYNVQFPTAIGNTITSLPISSSSASNFRDYWYKGVPLVYRWANTKPVLANGFANLNQRGFYINSFIFTLESGGSGGGAGGEVNIGTCTVEPGTTYDVEVGAGGAGGGASYSSLSEQDGQPGGASSFNGIVSLGGSGGGHSRNMTKPTNGYRSGGVGGFVLAPFDPKYILPGQGGSSAQLENATANDYINGCINNMTAASYSTISNGVDGITDEAGVIYSAGGKGGEPGIVSTITPAPNTGIGGSGTGAPLNTAAAGGDGASGVVVIKYYI